MNRYRWPALALLLCTLPARAHDFWIEPSRFVASAADEVAVTLRVGQQVKGDSVPFVDDWIRRFEVRDATGTRQLRGQVGDDPAARFVQRTPGATWIVHQTSDDFVELGPEKFRAYLEDEGLEAIVELRAARGDSDRPAREKYQRNVKALLWWPADGAKLNAGDAGLPLDLVPLANPYVLAPGDALPIEVRFADAPLPGVLVRAQTREAPERIVAARSDASGRVALPLAAPGTWLVKAVHMVALENDPDADWLSYWASLTFELAVR